ncbi:hypothetical protein [Streptomyces sp. NPDC060194]|uniref:hypothetical protein n=1 Tax=Streptomyces sp. NPDC060194 TaxID=3347069 RepID=UPI0036599103
MAEHEAADRDDSREPEERDVPVDEDAVWAAIVAGYGEEPADPPGAKPFKSVEDLARLEAGTNAVPEADERAGGSATDPEAKPDPKPAPDAGADRPLGGSVTFAPGVGPRDHALAASSEDDFDADDEGHFVPPEPPPLPEADATAKFAWLGAVGGPLLLLVAVLSGWYMHWWLLTLGIGGFLGGCATLVARMRTDEDDDGFDDPGRGAVV